MNANWEPIWTDLNGHVVFKGNRHNPMKIVAIGNVGQPGEAETKTVLGSEAHFDSPAGIISLRHRGKEYAVVADSGNKCLRLIGNIGSNRGNFNVSCLKLKGVGKSTPLALSYMCGSKLVMTCRDSSFVYVIEVNPADKSGSCLFTLDIPELCLASGLFFLQESQSLLISNDTNLLVIESQKLGSLRNKVSVHEFAECKSYGDVTVSPNRDIIITDPDQGLVHVVTNTGLQLVYKNSLGNTSVSFGEGRTSASSFEEPIGICYAGEALFTCCYGGGLKITTPTEFAIRYCNAVNNLYGIVNQSQPYSEQSFKDNICAASQTLDVFKDINDKRKLLLDRYVSTEQGGIYLQTIVCLEESLQSMEIIRENLSKFPGKLDTYSFINESPVEHGFGKSVQQSQYHVLSMKTYAQRKVGSEKEFIRKTCETPYSYYLTEDKQYQMPKKFPVTAHAVFNELKIISQMRETKEPSKITNAIKSEMKSLQEISKVYQPQPSQSVRDKYKSRCGYEPTIVHNVPVAQEEKSTYRHHVDVL